MMVARCLVAPIILISTPLGMHPCVYIDGSPGSTIVHSGKITRVHTEFAL
jgi:hypothetical protein